MKIVKCWLLDRCPHVYSFVEMREVRKKMPSDPHRSPKDWVCFPGTCLQDTCRRAGRLRCLCSAPWPHPSAATVATSTQHREAWLLSLTPFSPPGDYWDGSFFERVVWQTQSCGFLFLVPFKMKAKLKFPGAGRAASLEKGDHMSCWYYLRLCRRTKGKTQWDLFPILKSWFIFIKFIWILVPVVTHSSGNCAWP